MISISGIGPRPPPPMKAKRTGGLFAIDEPTVSGDVSEPCRIGVAGLLGLQETMAGTVSAPSVPTNADVRKYAETVLATLDQMQLSLLRGKSTLSTIADLQRLRTQTPSSADPGLQSAIEAIQVRAAVEAVRASKE